MFSRLLASNTALFVCDVQGAFVKAIYGIDELIGNTKFLLQCARVLKFPCVITEQYPEVQEYMKKSFPNVNNIVICGLEVGETGVVKSRPMCA